MPRMRCKLCTPPRPFANISKLRKHQRSAHADRWAPAPVQVEEAVHVEVEAPVPQTVPLPVAPIITGEEHLRMALTGYIEERERLNVTIQTLEGMLASTNGAKAPKAARKVARQTGSKRRISPEGRAAIAEATRKRWAAKRAQAAA